MPTDADVHPEVDRGGATAAIDLGAGPWRSGRIDCNPRYGDDVAAHVVDATCHLRAVCEVAAPGPGGDGGFGALGAHRLRI